MSAYVELEQAIRNLCIAAMVEYFPTQEEQDSLIYFSHDDGPEPSSPYIVINILGMDQKGRRVSSTLLGPDNLTLSTQANYEVSVQFGFCGSNSGSMAQTFTQRISNSQIVLDLHKRYKIGFMRKTNVRRTSMKRDTQWVDYFNLDVVFSYVVLTQDSVDYIEAVVVEDVVQETIFRVPEGPIPPI